MDLDSVKKYIGVVAAAVPIAIAGYTLAAHYLDDRFVPQKEYQTRQAKQEALLQEVRIDASIQILEVKRFTLEERIVTLDLCSISAGCRDALKGGLDSAKARTHRELDDVRAQLAEWKKQKNTPN
jgi:hypothetical protein